MNIFYVTGCTCSGKTTFINEIKGGGIVSVGAALRAKYTADQFGGQANPANMAQEALRLHDILLRDALEKKPQFVVVDGMPRNGQIDHILRQTFGYNTVFFHLYASTATRLNRLKERFPNPWTPEFDLGLKRLEGDQVTYYQTFVEMIAAGCEIEIIDTEPPKEIWIPQLIGRLR